MANSKGRPGYRNKEYWQGLMLRNSVWKDLYKSGLTVTAIGEKYGVSRATVHRALSYKVMPERIPRLLHQLKTAMENLGVGTEYASDLILLNMREEDAQLVLSPELIKYRKKLLDEKID